ncbi:MAG: murein biosynthesis integral membrane protein MurJ [Saezia sp.]
MNLWRSISSISLLTLASRITGMIRETIIYATFGTDVMTDAFNVAFRIPNMLRRLFAEGAFSQAFVPILASSKEQNTPEQTKQLLDSVASTLAFALLITCIIGIIGAPIFVYLLASGLKNGPGFDVAVVMTRWMFPYIGFMSLVALGAGVLNTWGRFAVAAAAPLMLNIAMITAGLLIYFGAGDWMRSHGWEPIYGLSFGVLVGGLLQLLTITWGLKSIQMVPRIRLGYKSLKSALAFSGTRRVLSLMLPAILGVSVAQLSLLINTQIASYMKAQGSISWLSAADRLMEFPTAILGVALGVVLLPQLSATLAKQEKEKYSGLLDWGLRLVVLLGMPCAIGLLFFAKPLVALLFHYGAFSDNALHQTSLAVQAYGVGILGLVAIKVLAPGFYAQQDIRTPVRIAILVLISTQVMNLFFIFVLQLQHVGLALSIALGALMNALLLLKGLIKRKSYIPHAGWLRFIAQVFAGCILLAVLLWFCNTHFQWESLGSTPLKRIGIVLSIIVGAIILYFGTLIVCGCKLKSMLRPRVRTP